MPSGKFCREGMGELVLFSREVGALTLSIAQILFGIVFVFCAYSAFRWHDAGIAARAFEAFAFVVCLRIWIEPARR